MKGKIKIFTCPLVGRQFTTEQLRFELVNIEFEGTCA